jgi:hypothetical protein|tara:strand:- start:6288 stop:6557 length:270 start_codon:yes stop_codon:yes gene_type:complete
MREAGEVLCYREIGDVGDLLIYLFQLLKHLPQSIRVRCILCFQIWYNDVDELLTENTRLFGKSSRFVPRRAANTISRHIFKTEKERVLS